MSIDDIKSRINKDKNLSHGSSNRYPIRFVFMDLSEKTSEELGELVSSSDGDLISLHEHLFNEDGWITRNSFRLIIDSCSKTKDSYVVGFSELVRFYSNIELESLLLSLVGDIENDLSDPVQSKRRIYIICFSMKEVLEQIICEKFRRFGVYNPFINLDHEYADNCSELFFVNSSLEIKTSKNVIKKSSAWLSLWKNSVLFDFSKPLLCVSDTLFDWYEKSSPDNAFQIDVIHNYKELISKTCLYDIPFFYDKMYNEHWKKLYELYAAEDKQMPIEELVLTVCNLKNIDYLSALIFWCNTDNSFNKWLISEYVSYSFPSSLADKAFRLNGFDRVNDVVLYIILYPFQNINTNQFEERNSIIQVIKKYVNVAAFEDKLQLTISNDLVSKTGFNAIDVPFDISRVRFDSPIDMEKREVLKNYITKTFIPSFTGIFNCEKEYLISFYALDLIEKDPLVELYPELYHYCSTYCLDDKSFINDYLFEYRKSKICGFDSESLFKMINDYNQSEHTFFDWYYSLKTQSEIIKSFSDPLFVVDGLGAEYYPVIAFVLSKYGYRIDFECYAVSHLPSITNVNKHYINLAKTPTEWFEDFDRNVIHGDFYRTCKNIRKAFETIDEIIHSIDMIQNGLPFVMTADHGATARGKWSDTEKKYYYENADHEGRCLSLGDKDESSTSDYINYHDDEMNNSWLVSLREISLNNNPKYEDHGGATPEEIIVPVIRAVKKDAIEEVGYNITLVSNKITGLDKTVEFIIVPKPDKVYLLDADNVTHELEFINNKWVTEISSGRTQTIKLFVDEKAYSFSLENASASNMKGNGDDFDFD